MKPLFLSLLFSLCIFQSASAQNPLVKMWDYRYGGIYWEFLEAFQQTSDLGFVMYGSTISNNDGDITEPSLGSYDFWFIKTDANGIKLWDKRFGGSDADNGRCGLETSDGGFILAGVTQSPISGDVTGFPRGVSDCWVVKTDATGIKLWDKRYGGIEFDGIWEVIQVSDGGFLFGGYTFSPISFDVTKPPRGQEDYWIIRTDSLGNKLWDKRFGGLDIDRLDDIKETADGGFLIGGSTMSDMSGDISEPSRGQWDYWVVKTDAAGNKLWDKRFGGNQHEAWVTLRLTNDGGCLVGGWSLSDISGEVTHPPIGFFTPDFWVVKIDSLGTKQWDARFGGNDAEDEIGYIVPTQDGGWLISLTSYSNISGNKSENNMGSEQAWIFKTDAQFNLQWDKTLLTMGHDENCFAVQSFDGCYVAAVINGSLAGGDKSQDTHDTAAVGGAPDFWIIKFCDTTLNPIAAFTAPNHVCPGSCIEFTSLSQSAFSYQWSFQGAIPSNSTSVNPSAICYPNPGTYDVQLIVSGLNGSDTVLLPNFITVFPYPAPQSITQNGDTLFAIAGSSSYQWYFNGNMISGATDYFHVAQSSGDYNVVATDGNGCEVEAVINNVQAHLPFAIGFWPLAVYPNPVISTLYIQGLEINSADEIKIFNVFGENVFSAVDWKLGIVRQGGSVLRRINCQLFPAGLYYLEITSNKKIYRTKFIKQ